MSLFSDPNAQSEGVYGYDRDIPPGASGAVPADFAMAVQQALMQEGINLNPAQGGITIAQFQALVQQAWQVKDIEQYYNQEYNGTSVLNPVNAGSLITRIKNAFFTPADVSMTDPNAVGLLQQGLGLRQQYGLSLNPAQTRFLQSGQTGTNTIANTIIATAQQMGEQAGLSGSTLQTFIDTALATAYHESNFNPMAVGDNGTSFGLYQLHEGGELGSMAPQQAFDPITNIKTALQQFLAVYKADPAIANDPGAWAVAAQRPNNAGNQYGGAIDALFQQISAGQIPKAGIPSGVAADIQYGITDPEAERFYSPIVSAWRKYFGAEPTTAQLMGVVGHGKDAQSWEDYIRSLPSHIPGMKAGDAFDLRQTANGLSQQYLGHDATDGLVKFFHDRQMKNPDEMKTWYLLNSPNQEEKVQYQKVAQANTPVMQAVYNESGFDPRIYQQQVSMTTPDLGATQTPGSSDAASTTPDLSAESSYDDYQVRRHGLQGPP